MTTTATLQDQELALEPAQLLHQAAAQGDIEAVRNAIKAGADLNALDSAGRTVVACALGGEDWPMKDAIDVPLMSESRLSILQLLLSQPSTSLLTLNAPQIALNGVTPLGFAAWLNSLPAVSVLLTGSSEAVAVDGMDTNRATPLMYAARDGNLDVVGKLLSFGARPDSRDANHRTPIQFSLPHSQILWLCEMVLRLHRWQDIKKRDMIFTTTPNVETLWNTVAASLPSFDPLVAPASKVLSPRLTSSTNALIGAILTEDLPSVNRLLFPGRTTPPLPNSAPSFPTTLLVNRQDHKGWSPIHHCTGATQPSIAVLDALYMAGADVSLFTTREQYTPLHVLALFANYRSTPPPDSAQTLYSFAVHLIQDLRAPLSAKDKDDNTCIHIAAKRGHCLDILLAFLDCDTKGYARELRNADGLTALQVAKPEFRSAFGADISQPHATPSRPLKSRTSVTSISSVRWSGPVSRSFSSEFDMFTSSQRLLSNLRLASKGAHQDPARMSTVLRDTQHIADGILTHFRLRAEAVRTKMDDARLGFQQAAGLLDLIIRGLDARIDGKTTHSCLDWQGMAYYKRVSEDSQTTAVSNERERELKRWSMIEAKNDHGKISVCTDTHFPDRTGRRSVRFPDWIDHYTTITSTATPNDSIENFEREGERRQKEGVAAKPVSKRKDATTKSGTAKLKSWFRRKIKPGQSHRLEVLRRIDEEGPVTRDSKDAQFSNVTTPGRMDSPGGSHHESQSLPPAMNIHDARAERVFRAIPVLAVAKRDMDSIAQHISEADRYLKTAFQSILRVERILQRAMKKRTEAQELPLRLLQSSSDDGSDLSTSNHSKFQPAGYTPSLFTAASSNISLSSTLVDADDDDTRALQRLVLRKIEARIGGALAEVDKVVLWLRITKEVLRGVKRRTYL